MARDEDERPAPDILLQEAKKEGRGKLKVFLGAYPGVGKTYGMLQAAQERRREGVDVVAAIVETHGRPETEALLDRVAAALTRAGAGLVDREMPEPIPRLVAAHPIVMNAESARAMGWELPDEEYTTIAGLVIHEARAIPEMGQRFSFYNFKFEVVRRQRNQITVLRVIPPEGMGGRLPG